MTRIKAIAISTFALAAVAAATPAFAAGWQVYQGGAWTNNGSATITGPTTATVAGIPIPCNASFTLTVSGGAASVTSASFSGSSLCTGINADTSPAWSVSAPAAISGSSSVNLTIGSPNPIVISFAQPPATCTGTASGTLTNANPNSGPANNSFTFTGTFPGTPCTGVRSRGALTSSRPIRATGL